VAVKQISGRHELAITIKNNLPYDIWMPWVFGTINHQMQSEKGNSFKHADGPSPKFRKDYIRIRSQDSYRYNFILLDGFDSALEYRITFGESAPMDKNGTRIAGYEQILDSDLK